MSKIIGIDLGTTNSAVAVMEGGKPSVVVSAEGGRTIPSMVALTKGGERLVGQLAKRQAVVNAKNTIFSVKRFIGRDFDDPEIQKELKGLPYETSKGPKGEILIKLGDKDYTPAEISAMILQKIKADAEAYLGEEVKEAVITVPAYFNDSQRNATKDAGKIAGLEVKRIINEPTAATLAYGLDKKKNEKIIIYDLGGGTFDVSILEIGDSDGESVFEVKATSGDTHLGGDDFDQKIIDWLIAEFKKSEGVDLSKDSIALQRLKDGAEKAKVELSSSQETEINLPFVTSNESGPKHLNIRLTRPELEKMVGDLVEKTMGPVKQALKDAGLETKDIDEVILVGGQTRMPAVQKIVKDFFGKELNKGVNPDEAVALGAAIQGGVLTGDVKDILLLDVTPLSLGIETLGGVATKLIEKNTTVPTSKTQIFSTAADNQTSVDVHVVQGEREMAIDNKSLGRFVLDGIPPSPRGVPQIEVTFDIDANGILNVSAKDKASGKEQKITITGSSGLSDEEVEKMRADAEKYAAEDKKKRGSIEIRNNAESLIYTAEKALKDAGDKVPADVKKEIEDKVKELKDAAEKDDAEEIKQKTEELAAVIQKIGSAAYGDTAKSSEEPNKDDNKKDDSVVDGEVTEEKDDEGQDTDK